MWLRAAHDRLLIRAMAATLAVIVCGGALDWGHAGGDDPDCSGTPVSFAHTAQRFSPASLSPSSGDHCYICHSLRLLHAGLVVRRERVPVELGSTPYRSARILAERRSVSVRLSSRAPPDVRL
jgi:hypothetical protein